MPYLVVSIASRVSFALTSGYDMPGNRHYTVWTDEVCKEETTSQAVVKIGRGSPEELPLQTNDLFPHKILMVLAICLCLSCL